MGQRLQTGQRPNHTRREELRTSRTVTEIELRIFEALKPIKQLQPESCLHAPNRFPIWQLSSDILNG